MPRIPVGTNTFENANILTVTAGTNCPAGGDSGHGGRTLLRIVNDASTDISVRIDGGELQQVDSVEIILGGDTECETFTQALEYAVSVLRLQQQSKLLGTVAEEID